MSFESAFSRRWGRGRSSQPQPPPTQASDSTMQPQQGPVASSSTSSGAGGSSQSVFNRIPVVPEAYGNDSELKTHRMLREMLIHTPNVRQGWFNATTHATILRQLYNCMWEIPGVDIADIYGLNTTPHGIAMVKSRNMHDWIMRREDGFEKTFMLNEYQKSVRTRPERRPGRACGRILQRYERTYTCRDCAIDPSCVLCIDCFQASEHEGHEVLFGQSFSFAATCDCGDPGAWKEGCPAGCSHHYPLSPSSAPDVPPANGVSDDPRITDDVIKALYDAIVISLEFIISTFELSPLPSEHSVLPTTEEELHRGVGCTNESEASRNKGPWCIALWQDDKHTIHEITRQLRDGIGCSWETAEQMALEMDYIGRVITLSTHRPMQGFHAASMMQQIEAPVTLRLGSDMFREQLAGVLITWLSDMCQSEICGSLDPFRRILFHCLEQERLGVGEGPVGNSRTRDLNDLSMTYKSKRIDWLLQVDTKLWKKAKFEWRQIYSSVYNLDLSIKCALSKSFAANYLKIFEHYLFHDRDLDANLLFSIAYMVFGSGQACEAASREAGLYWTIVNIAQSWYTTQVGDQQLIFPPQPAGRLTTDTPTFRSKRAITIFGHIRCLIRHTEMQRLVVETPAAFQQLVDFVNLFVGLQTQKREVEAHVEYEVEWTRSFALLGELARVCREFGESFHLASPDQLLSAMGLLVQRISRDVFLLSGTLDPEVYTRPTPHAVEDILVQGSRRAVLDLNMLMPTPFSFHHHIHLLLAEMFKYIGSVVPWENGLYKGMSFEQVIDRLVCGTYLTDDAHITKLAIIEWPMQKHVVLSQIRAEMWKKNGVAMRGQQHHYREVGVREVTIDQEFFLLQVGLCSMDPIEFFTALIDRYGLDRFFRYNVADPLIWQDIELVEPKQFVALLEDFVLLTINLVSDTSSIMRASQEEITRKYVIHQLALKSMAYSELIKKLPERSTERVSISKVLRDVAIFKEPTDTALGSYSLKDECYDEVDPYWRHYTRNDSRLAATKLVDRAKKADVHATPLLLPHPLRLPPAGLPFRDIADFLSSPLVCQIIFWAMAHCMPISNLAAWPGLSDTIRDPPQLENLLDLVLRLCLMAVQADPKNFAEHSVQIENDSQAMSIFQNLWYMQSHEAFKSFKPQADFLLNVLVEHLPERVTVDYRTAKEAENQRLATQTSPRTLAKQAAEARKKAVMAEFANMQAKVQFNLDENDEDDEDMDEEEAAQEEEISYGQCIVCQEQVTPKAPGGSLALLQPSRILREVVHERDWFEESLATPVCLDEATRMIRYGMGSTGEPTGTDAYPAVNHKFGVHLSACNHLMHETCLATYFDATRWRHTQQVQRHHPENAVRMEYLCPLCKSLGNFLIPVDPTMARLRPIKKKDGRLPTLSEKIRSVSEEGLIGVSDSARIWDYHVETGELTPWFTDCSFALHTLDPHNRKHVIRPISRMVERMRGLLRPLSEQSQRIRGKKTNMYFPEDGVAYTVSVIEATYRGIGRGTAPTIAEQIAESQLTLVKRLVGVLQLELDLFFGQKFDRTALRVGIFARFLPDWYRASSLPSPLLFRNPLALIIEAAAIAPDLLQPVIILAYYAELTRVMLGATLFIKRSMAKGLPPSSRSSPPIEPQLEDAMDVFADFKPTLLQAIRVAGPFLDQDGIYSSVTDKVLSKTLYSHTLPFLRRAAIVYKAVHGEYPNPVHVARPAESEYSKLLSVLAIPRPQETLSNHQSTEMPIVSRWLTQWAMQGRVTPMLEFPGTYELCRLPQKWETMVIKYMDVLCTVCKTKPTYPALCLLCGKILCLAGDCCSEGESGECNIHMRDCGAGIGVFVDIKRWVVLYLYAGSGCFHHMPYLDAHGELDISMRRGHRQYLHEARWDDIRRNAWLGHQIPHITARRLEMSSDGGGWGCL